MTHAVYLQAARAWLGSGRSSRMLKQGEWPLYALYQWVHSEASQHHGERNLIYDWLNASKAAQNAREPGWYGRFLNRETGCSHCSRVQQARMVSVCTLCHQLFCPWCKPKGTVANGNRRHDCGGEVV